MPMPTIARPSRATAEITSKSMWSSSASRSMNSWYTSSSTSSERASLRSTLLMTTIAGRFSASAFWST
jgi:hypothetical protein